MTDVVEKAFNAFTNALASQPSGVSDYDSAMGAALATLTPGSTWTTEDGVEVMVVRRDVLSQVVREAFSDGYKAGVDEIVSYFRNAQNQWLTPLCQLSGRKHHDPAPNSPGPKNPRLRHPARPGGRADIDAGAVVENHAVSYQEGMRDVHHDPLQRRVAGKRQ